MQTKNKYRRANDVVEHYVDEKDDRPGPWLALNGWAGRRLHSLGKHDERRDEVEEERPGLDPKEAGAPVSMRR